MFCNQEGNAPEGPNIRARHFLACLKVSKLWDVRFHDLRHTFATLRIQNREPIPYVQAQLGHSTIKHVHAPDAQEESRGDGSAA